jgi:hypothetical protein
VAKSGFLHPVNALHTAVLGTADGVDQHVEARKQAVNVNPTRIINETVVDNKRAALWKGLMCLFQEQLPGWKIPIVQDSPHNQDVGLRQLIFEKISPIECQTLFQAALAYLARECLLDLRQIKTAASQVRLGAGDLDRHAALPRADVDDRPVGLPREA